MRWVAPTEKDTANETLEKHLWAAADQLRANSGLTSAQYSTPVLGLIFLRFAEARFTQRRAALDKAGGSSRRGGSRVDDPAAYHAEGVLYLTPNACFDHLLQLPERENIGRKLNEAMADVEKHNAQLAGVLPRTYQVFNSTLLKELLKKVSEIPVSLDYDAFGRIYEYFLGAFARTEGQKGGEFYTPSPIVRLMVEILEPFHGRVLDLACGSGGMFVQSARFVHEHRKNPAAELSIHGQEKVGATVSLCRMNLAMHGLEGDIREGIIARIIGPKLAEKLGQQIVVDNRPSAGGIVAFNIVAEATPDGHTLTTTGSNFAGSAALYGAKLPYDPVRDFAGITQIATTPLILVVASSLGAKSVKELIALAKQKPGQLNFGSSGIGSGPHYGAALFQLAAGINVVHVPYRGSPEAFNDMIAGRLDYFLSPIMAAVPFIKSGRVLALGVTTAQRAPPMPDVPTIAEAGLAGFEYEGWYGLLAPGKTPRKIVNLLSSEIGSIVELPDIKERIASLGAAAKRSTPEEFDKLVRDEIRMRTKVWQAAGVKVE